MCRALGDNRLADSGEYEPMNMINTPSATSNRIEEADIPFDVALAAYHAALEAQENGEKDTKMPESEFDILASARADATRRLIRTPATNAERSEEHTSELQSLMRISYAVFCLTKKK